MQGDSGNDQLSGGAGVNTLSGGPGKYSFICSPNSEYRFDPVRLLDAAVKQIGENVSSVQGDVSNLEDF